MEEQSYEEDKQLVAKLDAIVKMVEEVRRAISSREIPMLDKELEEVVASDIQLLLGRGEKVTLQKLMSLEKERTNGKGTMYHNSMVRTYVKKKKNALKTCRTITDQQYVVDDLLGPASVTTWEKNQQEKENKKRRADEAPPSADTARKPPKKKIRASKTHEVPA